MAFPTTSVLDDFNRANTGPPPSANWTSGAFNTSGLKVVSNQALRVAGANGDGFWNPSTFGPDGEVFVTLVNLAASGNIYLYLRLNNVPGFATANGYALYAASAGSTIVYRIDPGGAATQIGSTMSPGFTAGDSVGASIAGSTISVYKKTGGVWSLVGTRSESTYTTSGYIGLAINDNDTQATDDFGGGTILSLVGSYVTHGLGVGLW